MPSIKRERDAPSSSSSESKGSKLHSNYSVKDELDSDDDDTKPDVRGSPNKKPKKVSGSAAGRGSGDGKGNGKGKSGGKGKGSKEVHKSWYQEEEQVFVELMDQVLKEQLWPKVKDDGRLAHRKPNGIRAHCIATINKLKRAAK